MASFATAGAKIYIGGTHAEQTADFTESDFSGETWTQVKEVESIGTYGDTAEAVEFATIDDPRKKTLKGVRSAGSMDIVCGIDYADAGQLALIAAEKTRDNYAIKIEFNDAPSGGTPSIRYFIGLVMAATEQLDAANNVMKLNGSIAINSNIVRVAAAAA